MSRQTSGTPYPLGATSTSDGVNFSLFSANAEMIDLCLFDQSGAETRVPLQRTGDIWHVHMNGLTPGQAYGYRAHGPWAPESGHRFNPMKLLLDPYARSMTAVPVISRTSYDYVLDDEEKEDIAKGGSIREDRVLTSSDSDNVHQTPKCLVTGRDPSATRSFKSHIHLADTLIYELHVKGFTRLRQDLPDELRGRYRGLGHDNILEYLKGLGVTSIELLPVQEYVDESFLLGKGFTNYWGYNPICFFIPTRRYSTGEPRFEFRSMVNRLHDAGIEVILDVVYNHTAEGDQFGPTFSYRGIDNASYYKLNTEDKRHYVNDSGCGNSLNLEHPAVLQLVSDSLRYWVTEMDVDGFRFDLAPGLARRDGKFDQTAPFFQTLRQDPVLNRVKLIAEPWDLGSDGYQFGYFPQHWSEWNDQYRDTVRKFWRGDPGILPQFAHHVHGSSGIFEQTRRPPQASINFITSHDGFTLTDIVSYSDKHNEANLEANRDGHSENYSFNHGVEGDTTNTSILSLREKQKRNLLTTLLVSQGVPMIHAGDELSQTKRGNNNSYCHDNELNWIDWSALSQEPVRDLHDYIREVIHLRRDWQELRSERFIHGSQIDRHQGLGEIQWLHPDGHHMTPEDWQDATLFTVGLMLHGGAMFPERKTGNRLILIQFNANVGEILAKMPGVPMQGNWHCRLSSADGWRERNLNLRQGETVALEDRSISLFEFVEQPHE